MFASKKNAAVLAIGTSLLLGGIVAGANSAAADSRNPGGWYQRIDAYSNHVFHEVFYAGEQAQVHVLGDGDTDLDLFVYDENGELICSSETFSDRESCSWYPRWTGSFYIEVMNLGSVYNQADVITN